MKKHILLLSGALLLISSTAFAQLAANPWENKSAAQDKAERIVYKSSPSLPGNETLDTWQPPELGYVGDKTIWTTDRGQDKIAPDANITNVLLMTQHLRNMGYQIPDGLDKVITTSPAWVRQQIVESMRMLQSSGNPVATASNGFAKIFESHTGLSLDNLIMNSIRIIDARR